ncbi:hypothetical protein F5Y18DRAFT_405726 [Xylariaceae sp. FL1019]|nr:hypothetical protein F5Y18DRAFT_405726 [Xylariaceae sp. FL1019]
MRSRVLLGVWVGVYGRFAVHCASATLNIANERHGNTIVMSQIVILDDLGSHSSHQSRMSRNTVPAVCNYEQGGTRGDVKMETSYPPESRRARREGADEGREAADKGRPDYGDWAGSRWG